MRTEPRAIPSASAITIQADAEIAQWPAGEWLRGWLSQHPTAADLLLGLVISVVLLTFEALDAGEAGARLDWLDVAICAFATGLIVLRRRAPMPILAISVVAGMWSMTPDDDQVVLRVAACLALYTVASTSARRTAWIAGLIAAAVLFTTAMFTNRGPGVQEENLEIVAWAIVATAVGDAVRSRRAYFVARQERALALQDRAEQALEAEARRLVVEERLRIARELHDVIAHHIAVITVQAGAASHLVRSDPSGAEEALAHVRRGANTVLSELSSMLTVMRRTDDLIAANDPIPTLDQLDALIAGLAEAGLVVDLHVSGEARPVSPAISLAAYRIIQESLTNAHRHGSNGQAKLQLGFKVGSLQIEVSNQINEKAETSNRRGHGLIGMRERAAAAGGTIEIGPTDDRQFRVTAELPMIEDVR